MCPPTAGVAAWCPRRSGYQRWHRSRRVLLTSRGRRSDTTESRLRPPNARPVPAPRQGLVRPRSVSEPRLHLLDNPLRPSADDLDHVGEAFLATVVGV